MYRPLAASTLSTFLLLGSATAFGAQPAAEISIGTYFVSEQRDAVRSYYYAEVKSGHCPRGLEKKNSRCMPPGQTKQWALGQALPGKVKTYSVPSALAVKIGLPPAGHKYVRVGADILLVALSSNVVIDVISNLGGL